MKLIIVNISKTSSLAPIDAIRRAWDLKIETCLDCDFVIGVAKGKIIDVYKFINVSPDLLQPERVAFCLAPCTPFEKFVIRFAIDYNKINLKHFVVKSITDALLFNV